MYWRYMTYFYVYIYIYTIWKSHITPDSRTVKEVDAAGGSSRRHTFGRWASQARGVASQAWAVGLAGMGILPYGYTQYTIGGAKLKFEMHLLQIA